MNRLITHRPDHGNRDYDINPQRDGYPCPKSCLTQSNKRHSIGRVTHEYGIASVTINIVKCGSEDYESWRNGDDGDKFQ